MRRNSKKGFTLAELLIVIAIIAVLVAIMLPVFGAQLDKARAAAELSNVRAAYSEAVANAMLGDGNNLTIAEGNEIKVKVTELEAACQFDQTKIDVTEPVTSADGTKTEGSIKVTYKGYSGTFDTDADVTFDKEGATRATPAGE